MKLFKKDEINKIHKDQTRELILKNRTLISSLKKTLALQKEIDFEPEKAKKVKEYQVWCEELQKKMSEELRTLEIYKKLTEEEKEKYYNMVVKLDAIQDKIYDLEEEISKLDLQIKFKEELLNVKNNR